MTRIPPGFMNPLRPRAKPMHPSVPVQTIAEMRAYCRVHGIEITGPVLAQREFRAGPHPKSAYPHLPGTRSRTVTLLGQVDFTKMGGD